MLKAIKIKFLIGIFFILNCDVHCEYKESVVIQKSLYSQGISELINSFNKNNIEILKNIILQNFNQLSKEQMDTLIILIEPVFEVNPLCKSKFLPNMDSTLDGGIQFPFESRIFNIKPMLKNQSVYSCITKPEEFKKDTTIISARIYNRSKIQEYFIEIVEPASFKNNIRGELKTGKIVRFHHFENQNTRKMLELPIEIKSFSINNQTFSLQRCLIYDNKIFSISCLEEKFPNLSFEQIVKEHLIEMDDCDIDNVFTKYE